MVLIKVRQACSNQQEYLYQMKYSCLACVHYAQPEDASAVRKMSREEG
jgi:hypothetical protein